MPDYKNSKIYRIVCNETGEQYIGSTTQSLSVRLAKHVWSSKNEPEKGCKSFPIIDRGDYSIVLIENCPCESKEQLLRRERHFIETMDCVNRNIPGRTKLEHLNRILQWQKENPEKRAEYSRKWRKENPEKVAEQKRKHYQSHKEQKSEYNRKYHLMKKAQHPPAYRALQDASMNTLLSTLESEPPMQQHPIPTASSSSIGSRLSAGDV